jgi:hypothetical protein
VSTVLAFPQSRTLAQVLAELMLAEAELKRLMDRPGPYDLTKAEDARWSQLEDTIYLRRDEAKAMIEAATGVSWSAIEGAGL